MQLVMIVHMVLTLNVAFMVVMALNMVLLLVIIVLIWF